MIADSILRDVLFADLGVMAVSGLGFLFWKIFNQRAAIETPLKYSLFSMLFRALLPLFLLFGFSSLARADGFTILWVRWVVYCFAYNFGGLTHILVFAGQHPKYHWRWVAGTLQTFGFAMFAIGSQLGDFDQRLILYILGTVGIVAGSTVMLMSRRVSKLSIKLILLAEFFLSLLLPVFFALGPNMWRLIAPEWEALTYLGIDVLAFPLGIAAICLVHCPCPNLAKTYAACVQTDREVDL
jgi:hypothetical protein